MKRYLWQATAVLFWLFFGYMVGCMAMQWVNDLEDSQDDPPASVREYVSLVLPSVPDIRLCSCWHTWRDAWESQQPFTDH